MLDPGYYANIFEVSVPKMELKFVTAERRDYPKLKELREEIERERKVIFVFAPQGSDKVYGYGEDMEWLLNKGFQFEQVNLYEFPKLTARMIIEGVIGKAGTLGYKPTQKDEGRYVLFNQEKFRETTDGEVKVYQGYDVRSLYLRDSENDELKFCLVVDVCFSFKDVDDEPLNFRDITLRFGTNTLKEVRRIQKDLIPTGINPEVSRQRLLDDIVPFIEELTPITLPCSLKCEINVKPCRIVVGVQE